MISEREIQGPGMFSFIIRMAGNPNTSELTVVTGAPHGLWLAECLLILTWKPEPFLYSE